MTQEKSDIKETKGQATKEKILKATWEMLESRGSSVRMSDIAKQAGVSRQAVYLYYPSRAQLLIETTKFAGDHYHIEDRLRPSRQASTGLERLDTYVEAWGGFLPLVLPILDALRAMKDMDAAAEAAYADRMAAMREGCAAVVDALKGEGTLTPHLSTDQAVDLMFSTLWIDHYERLVKDGSWSETDYSNQMKRLCAAFLQA